VTHRRGITARCIERGDNLVQHADVECLGEIQKLFGARERHRARPVSRPLLAPHRFPLGFVGNRGLCDERLFESFDAAIPSAPGALLNYLHSTAALLSNLPRPSGSMPRRSRVTQMAALACSCPHKSLTGDCGEAFSAPLLLQPSAVSRGGLSSDPSRVYRAMPGEWAEFALDPSFTGREGGAR